MNQIPFVTAKIVLPDNSDVGLIVAQSKTLKTGSVGYFGTGKLEIDGKRYQCQVQLVEIGSKPKGE